MMTRVAESCNRAELPYASSTLLWGFGRSVLCLWLLTVTLRSLLPRDWNMCATKMLCCSQPPNHSRTEKLPKKDTLLRQNYQLAEQ